MATISAGRNNFQVDSVVLRSFLILFRNILPFGLLALVLTSPTYIYAILIGSAEPFLYDGYGSDIIDGENVAFIIEFLLGDLVAAALVYGTIQDLQGNRVGAKDSFSQGMSRMFSVLGVAMVTSIVILLAFVPAVIGAVVFDPSVLLVLAIPAVIFALMLWVAIPVAVVEQRGIGSLRRSMELTKGYRLRLFSVSVVLAVFLLGLTYLIDIVTDEIAIADSGETGATFIGIFVIEWTFTALTNALMAVVYAVSYHDLRIAKDGVDSDRIAAMFN